MTYSEKMASGVESEFGCSLKEACKNCVPCSDVCKSMDVSRKLQDAGMRITRQRVELAQLLFGNGDRHFTADALYDEAMGSKIPVSLATVYNTLQQFVTAGLIRKLGIEGQKSWYDTNISEHHHLFSRTKIISMISTTLRSLSVSCQRFRRGWSFPAWRSSFA